MTWREITYEREKLYAEVWEEPVLRVALRYGISNVGLAKICRRLSVPLPPRGYWARIQAGRKLRRPPLSAFRGKTVLHSKIYEPEDKPQGEVERILLDELNVAIPSPIVVADSLVNPHPLVKQTRDALRSSSTSEYGVLWRENGLLNLRVSPESLNRALRILDAFIKTVEELDWNVIVDGHNNRDTFVLISSEKIEFGIEETVRRSEHALTPQETRKKALGEYVREVRWDYIPTGKLTIRIKEYGGEGLRKTWSDTYRFRLEEKIIDVLEEVRRYAARKIADRRERERKTQEKAVMQVRLADLHAKREAEKHRIEELELQTRLWSKANLIRSFVEAVRQIGIKDSDWSGWALNHADRVDPLKESSPQASEKSIEEIELEQKLREPEWRWI
jgi:hypothetical protein